MNNTDQPQDTKLEHGQVLAVHAVSAEATYPNALNGPWETRLEEYHHETSAFTGTMYRIRAYSPEHTYPQHDSYHETLEAAQKRLADLEQRVRESGVTADTPRTGHCCHCDRSVSAGSLQLWQSKPFWAEEDNYDGCRGWD